MRRLAVVAVVAVLLVTGVGWLTLVRPADDGVVWGWSATDGRLKVADRGFGLMPRWTYQRLASHPLEATVSATSADGAPVTVRVYLSPPVGIWQLVAADTPADGLARAVAAPVTKHVSKHQAACLADGAACDTDAAADLRYWLATTLRLPERAVTLEVQGECVLLADRAQALDIPRSKVLVLALDAADWRLLLPWIEQGRLPNLERLLRAGTWGEMETIEPMMSPIIWTTIATGVSPEQHGVLDFVEQDPVSGSMVPVTGRSRKVPALWNIASAFGLQVGVVGWWATWPAERINGVMVSDRLYYTLNKNLPAEVVRGEIPDLVFPAQRESEFTALRDRAVNETDWQAVRRFMAVSREEFDRAVAANRGMDDPIDGLRRILSASRTYLSSGLELAADRPDLLLVYLEGTDTIGHLLAPYLPPPTVAVDSERAAVYAAAIPVYFEMVDRTIGSYLERCPLTDYAVMVLSDHGFKWQEDRPQAVDGTGGATAPLWHARGAIYLMAGKGVEQLGRVQEWASVYHVTASVASLLGIPPGTGWQHAVLPGCPPPLPETLDYQTLIPPASYRTGGETAAPVDPEQIAKLQALGYLDPQADLAGTPAAAATPIPQPEPGDLSFGQLNNLGIMKANAKEYASAERYFRQAIAAEPTYAGPHYNLRHIYFQQGRYDEADRELWQAVAKGLRDAQRSIDTAAADYEKLGLPDRAERLLGEAIRRFPEHESFYVHMMFIKIQRQACREGLSYGAEAARRFPDSGPVHSFYGAVAACAGQVELAKKELARAYEINPNDPLLRETMSQLQ